MLVDLADIRNILLHLTGNDKTNYFMIGNCFERDQY